MVDLPAGFVGDPQAAQQCPLHELVTGVDELGLSRGQPGRGGSASTGMAHYEGEFTNDGRQNIPVYNMVPEHGYPAEFGFIFAEKPLIMYASVVGSGASDARARERSRHPGVSACSAFRAPW